VRWNKAGQSRHILFGLGVSSLCEKGKRGGRGGRRGRRGTKGENNEVQKEKKTTTSKRVRTMNRTRGEEGGGRLRKRKHGEQETAKRVERGNDEEGKALTQYSNLRTLLPSTQSRCTQPYFRINLCCGGIKGFGAQWLRLGLKAYVTLKPRMSEI
jgi:hypothetical protein